MNDVFSATALSRRTLLRGAVMTGALKAAAPAAFAQAMVSRPPVALKLSLFSKIMQWTDLAEAARLGKQLGYDCMDLTVRRKGHVLPENVEVDLPRAVQTVQRAGLEVSMISTEITGAESPSAEAMLKTASALGIRHYRWGGLTYKPGRGIEEQLNALKPRIRALAELNAKYKICGMYHTHSGIHMVGGPIWDLWTLFQGLDARFIGMNYDIGHATIEGGFGGWQTSARLAASQMRGIALKDFRWPPKGTPPEAPAKPAYQPEPAWCPVGEGIVDFVGFFEIVRKNRFDGPIQMHFEYPEFHGVENGETALSIPREQLLAMMGRDVQRIRGYMKQAELT